MEIGQLKEVSNISPGVIASITGMAQYADQDKFAQWLWAPIFENELYYGQLAAFGANSLIGLKNAHTIYTNKRISKPVAY